MDTFIPLTLLRRNIADLEDAIIVAEYNSSRATAGKLEGYRKSFSNRPIPSYESLLSRVKAMSALLNNDLQLVIGSVTVQVFDHEHPSLA
jgi:hypothetical protein